MVRVHASGIVFLNGFGDPARANQSQPEPARRQLDPASASQKQAQVFRPANVTNVKVSSQSQPVLARASQSHPEAATASQNQPEQS